MFFLFQSAKYLPTFPFNPCIAITTRTQNAPELIFQILFKPDLDFPSLWTNFRAITLPINSFLSNHISHMMPKYTFGIIHNFTLSFLQHK